MFVINQKWLRIDLFIWLSDLLLGCVPYDFCCARLFISTVILDLIGVSVISHQFFLNGYSYPQLDFYSL